MRFSDELRPDAAPVVAWLQGQGVPLALLSGDENEPVHRLARRLGIEEAFAKLMPKDKIDRLQAWRANGERVLMVGDGVNDAPSLAVAHASLSPASAADISLSAADMVFQGISLRALPETLLVAREARRRVLQNFLLAATYNAVNIPLAVAGFVTPLLAAVAMSTSSILVTLNALRLRTSPKPWAP